MKHRRDFCSLGPSSCLEGQRIYLKKKKKKPYRTIRSCGGPSSWEAKQCLWPTTSIGVVSKALFFFVLLSSSRGTVPSFHKKKKKKLVYLLFVNRWRRRKREREKRAKANSPFFRVCLWVVYGRVLLLRLPVRSLLSLSLFSSSFSLCVWFENDAIFNTHMCARSHALAQTE